MVPRFPFPGLASTCAALTFLVMLGASSAAAAFDVDPISVNNDNPYAVLNASDDKPGNFNLLQVSLLVNIWRSPPPLANFRDSGRSHLKSAPDYGALQPVVGTVDAIRCAGSSGVAVDPAGKFAYMSGGFGSPGRVCGFVIDALTKTLTPVTAAGIIPVAAGSNPGAVAIDPTGRFVYVPGNGNDGSVAGYSINRTTGVLTPLPGSPFPTNGEFPGAIAIDRSGRFMYVGQSVGSFSGSTAVFAIDPVTGALSQVPGSPFPVAEGRVSALALSPDGRHLFTGGVGIGTYAVNTTTGVPTRIAYRTGYYFGLAVEPTGRFLYAPEFFSSQLHGFSIAATGLLTPVGSPQVIGSVSRAVVSVADLIYIGSSGTDQTYGFRINPSTGALTPVAGSPFATPTKPNALAATGSLPGAVAVDAGDSVVTSVGVFGGRPPYAWSVTAGSLPPGLVLNASTGILSGVATTAGTFGFTVQAIDSVGAAVTSAKSITVLGGTTSPAVTIVEFYNAALDHYFITYASDEIAKLDNGTFKGWARTGLSFNAFSTAQTITSAVCRIYIPPGKGDGHFFGRDANECDGTMAKNPTFILESGTFLYLYPPTLGNCAAGQVPVYRVFSNRADANHRYTTSRAVRDQMVAKGWLAEGDGADTVVMCAPG